MNSFEKPSQEDSLLSLMNNKNTSLIELDKGQRLMLDNALFYIKQGAFKKIKITEDGREQIAHFYYPEEIIGCSSKDNKLDSYQTVSLTTSIVYKISEHEILKQMHSKAPIQTIIFQLMTRRMSLGSSVVLNANADERILAFLLDAYARNIDLENEKALTLVMSYKELGNFLGLSPETISRRLKHLAKKGYFCYKNRTFWRFNFPEMNLMIS